MTSVLLPNITQISMNNDKAVESKPISRINGFYGYRPIHESRRRQYFYMHG